MKRAIIFTMILAIACISLGIVLGVTIEKKYHLKSFSKIGRVLGLKTKKTYPEKERLENKVNTILITLDKKLDLSDIQEAGIKEILQEAKKEVMQAQGSLRNQFSQIRDNAGKQITELLDTQQKIKFEEITAKGLQQKEETFLGGN